MSTYVPTGTSASATMAPQGGGGDSSGHLRVPVGFHHDHVRPSASFHSFNAPPGPPGPLTSLYSLSTEPETMALGDNNNFDHHRHHHHRQRCPGNDEMNHHQLYWSHHQQQQPGNNSTNHQGLSSLVLFNSIQLRIYSMTHDVVDPLHDRVSR